MLEWLSEGYAVAIIGGITGIMLGLAARIGQFCTLGAIEDYIYGGDARRLKMWGIAVGVSIFGIPLRFYISESLIFSSIVYVINDISLMASIVGGLVFGFGMAISGNCGYGALLARLGGGDLRSFVIVIVLGISAYTAMTGPFAELRLWLFPVSIYAEPQSISTLISGATSINMAIIGMAIGVIITSYTIWSGDMLLHRKHIFWGAIVGLSILGAWAGTYYVAENGFGIGRLHSHSFAQPIGETTLFFMTREMNRLPLGSAL